MQDVNPKNAERWINSYFDFPHTIHCGAGALGAVGMWVVGALDVAFSQPPTWVYVAAGAGVSAVTYAIDMGVTTLINAIRS
jgi:hypothetical protein